MSAESTGTTTHTPTLPGGSDGTLVALSCFDVDNDADDAVTGGAGWTTVLTDTSAADGALVVVAARDATGSDTLTWTTDANEKSAHVIYRLANNTPVSMLTPEAGTRDKGTDETPDPGSVTPAGGSDTYTFIEYFCLDAAVGAATAESSGYSSLRQTFASGGGAVRIATADRREATGVSSEDPGVFTVNDVGGNTWVAGVVAITPGSGGGSSPASSLSVFLPLVSASTAPSILIQSPTQSGTWSTTDATILISGTASDPDDSISSVTWDMTGCTTDSGTADGTDSWSDTISLTEGDCQIVFTVTDGESLTDTATITVTRAATDSTPPVIALSSPSTPHTATSSPIAVSGTLTDGGSGPDDVSVVQRSGPAGCTPGSVTGAGSWSVNIACTQQVANAIFRITGCDAVNLCDSLDFDLTFTGGAVTITTGSIVDCQEGEPYQAFLSAQGGVTPYAWDQVAGSTLGDDPGCSGLSFADNGDQGEVTASSCGATAPDTCSFTARVTDDQMSVDTVAYSFNITSAGVNGNAYYDNLVATKTVRFSNSFRSDTLIDAATGTPPNQFVDYDGTLDAAVMTIRAFDPDQHSVPGTQQGTDGIPLGYYLDVDFEVDGPPDGTFHTVTTWDEYYFPEWTTQIVLMEDSGGGRLWRNSKTTHLGGYDDYTNSGNNAPGNDGEYMKYEDTYRPSFLSDGGHKRLRVQAYTWELGSNPEDWTNNEPVQPNNFPSFTVATGVWTRHWIFIDQTGYGSHVAHPSVSPAETPTCNVQIWLADENRAPTRVFGPMPFHCGWDTGRARGWNRISHRHSPKPSRVETDPGPDGIFGTGDEFNYCADVVHNCPQARVGFRNHITYEVANEAEFLGDLEMPVP